MLLLFVILDLLFELSNNASCDLVEFIDDVDDDCVLLLVFIEFFVTIALSIIVKIKVMVYFVNQNTKK